MTEHEAFNLAIRAGLVAFAYVGVIAILCRILANLPEDDEDRK